MDNMYVLHLRVDEGHKEYQPQLTAIDAEGNNILANLRTTDL